MSAIIPGARYWDGTQALDFCADDGGRAATGFKGRAGDCVCRSIAIASGNPYADVYAALAAGTGTQRKTRGRKRAASARNGINTTRQWFKDYMRALGFSWTPTMRIGSGCKVHLLRGELPMGRLVVCISGHYTAVIDGVIHDTYDPTRTTLLPDEFGRAGGGHGRMLHRCVYGYWQWGAR